MTPKVLSWFLLVGTLSWGIVSSHEDCPHPEDSYPCYCEEDDDRSVMHCNNLQENKQIVQALQGLSGYKIYTLSMWMFDTGTIKSDAFKGPKINEITFTHAQINMESPPFLGQEESLGRLSFSQCFDEEDFVGSWSLGHLHKLKEISFDKNDIQILKNDWLTSSGDSLRSISFDECKIEELEDSVFSKVSSLTTLFLMNNKVTTVLRSMFPKTAENLRSINLSGNRIVSLPDDMFKDMPSLLSIDLGRNQIKSIGETTWEFKIEELTRVYLEDNPIKCDKSLKWISKKALPKMFTGECAEPAKLKNKAIRHLTPADFH